jgi:hypothetical protein
MAKLGTKRPAVVRVRTQKRAIEIVGLCDEHNIKAIVGIEPDKAEDIRDVELALSRLTSVAANAKIGRHEPFSAGSSKYRDAPAPTRRVDFATLPPEVQIQFSTPQYAAFADAEFTVDGVDIEGTVPGDGGSQNMATEIRLQLSEPRGSEVSHRGARSRKRYSFSVIVTDHPPIDIERDDTVRLVFVAAFGEGDAPDNPTVPWHPILLANCTSGQYVVYGTEHYLAPPPLLKVLKVVIGLTLLAGLGLAVYAPHRQHKFSFLVAALSCIALACWLKRVLRQAEESSERRLERIAHLARDYPV